MKQRKDIESQTSPIQITSHQDSEIHTELFPRNQTNNTPVQCFNDPHENQLDTQETNAAITSNYNGGGNIPPSKKGNFTNRRKTHEG